ncbi:hypothetical protein BAE44_0020795 [Dichanthelium oligosanthes]|uniref:DUF8039 domain-containing protein n=1 Tax=Dichanthelium oligosanthes TaxID=888268 RepID=A0A1E5UZ60_9POAL|nr:hypothetical protein BAE44_0020795 [Dichanthelium oligosanthes]
MKEIDVQSFVELLKNSHNYHMADSSLSKGERQWLLATSALIGTLSSVAMMATERYPVDDLRVDTPCKLVVPNGRNLNKFCEVATGMGMPGHEFHCTQIPPNYAKVQVVT